MNVYKTIYASLVFFLLFCTISCSNRKNDEEKKEEIKKVKPERGPIESLVSSTGRVISNLDVEIKCKASGEIISLPFDISDIVKKGDLVVELDPIDEQRNVDKAQVALQSSLARLEKARTSLQISEIDLDNAKKKAKVAYEIADVRAKDARAKADRVKELYGQKLASFEDLETAQTSAAKADSDLETARIQLEELKTQEESLKLQRQDVNLAQSDYESARINLSIAEQRLKETKVYSPIDGVVTVRKIQIGQIISSGISNVGGGTTIMTISDLSRLFILASVDESDIGKVAAGQNVAITADAYSDIQFDGIVERIAQQGVNSSNVVTFEVRMEVLSENKSLLKPEMTANVDVVLGKKDDVIQIPLAALSRIKGKYFVTILKDDGSEEQREIEIGINNGESVEIIKGLTESDTVAYKTSGAPSEWRRPGGPLPPMGGPRGGGRR